MNELRAGTVLRFARALVAAAVAVALGVAAHVSAGGLLPSPGWLAFGLALLACGFAAFLGRPASRLLVTGLVVGGQFVTHLALTAMAGHAGDDLAGHAGAGARARPVDLARALEAAASGPRRGSLYDLTSGAVPNAGSPPDLAVPHWLLHVVEDLNGPHALMALAHVVAAAGVAWWLAVGEHALWLVICWIGLSAVSVALAVVRRRVPPPVAAPTTAAAYAGFRDRPRLPLPPPLLGALARRGPPAAAFA